MKKQNWILGLVISLGISLIIVSTRMIRMNNIETGFVAVGILYNFLFCFSYWIIYSYLFHKTGLLFVSRYKVLIRASAIIGVALLSFVFDYLFSLFTPKVLQFIEMGGSKRSYIILVRGLLISGLFYFISYYLHVLAEKQKSSLEIEQLKQAQLAANLSSLKEQLSPHFLFNTLNTLSSLTQEKLVKDCVAELASVYRYVLQYKEMDTATLKEELTFIESYLYIIKTRLENAIEVIIDVSDNFLKTKIPPLTLQLLIENAIKHNIVSSSKQLRIEIKNSGEDYLSVTNNFQPRSSVQHTTGTGLANIMRRYKLLFDKEITIEKSNTTFTVKLPAV